MSVVLANCDTCKRKISATKKYFGKKVACPGCRNIVLIPFPELKNELDDLIPKKVIHPVVPLTQQELNNEREENKSIQYGSEEKPNQPKQKYATLRFVSNSYRRIGYAICILAILVSLFLFFAAIAKGGPLEIIISLLAMPCLASFSISFFAISELILVLLDIEKNTRRGNNEIGNGSGWLNKD